MTLLITPPDIDIVNRIYPREYMDCGCMYAPSDKNSSIYKLYLLLKVSLPVHGRLCSKIVCEANKDFARLEVVSIYLANESI